jgi:hypothetical protein
MGKPMPTFMTNAESKFDSIIFKSMEDVVTGFINALPGNISVNTVQHTTTEEAVFSASAVTSQQWIVIM